MSGPRRTDLLERTAALVSIPSVSGDEAAVASFVAEELAACPWLEVTRVGEQGENVVARTTLGRHERLLVAGHLDTVPPSADATARIEGDVLWGLGACDMKGGIAVMVELASTLRAPAVDVTWCFYACEEVARDRNGLRKTWRERPELLSADAAVLMEPTDARVEAGCQGTLNLAVHLSGRRAHTARPATGRNAIHRLGPLLERISGWAGREVTLDGCTYREQLQAVRVEGGVANNVVPDGATLRVNHRFAPDRDAAGAAGELRRVLDDLLEEDGDRVELVDAADGAPPSLEHPLLAALVSGSGEAPRAKVGWTDVATMWEHGVPAANFGPGDPLLAHRADEHVERSSLERCRDVLVALLVAEPAG